MGAEERQAIISDELEAVVVEDGTGGHVVEVTIARPGVSQNGYIYSEAVLRDGSALWNGAPAFLDHPTALDLTRAGSRSLRDLVGVYEGARYEAGRGIRARLRLSPNDQGAFATIRESVGARASGRIGAPVGISADWRLVHSAAAPGEDGKARREVHRIAAVNSGDLVVRPSAGGSFDRILEGVRWQVGEAGTVLAAAVGVPGGGVFPMPEGRNGGSTSVQPAQTDGPPGGGAVYGVEGVVERAVAEALAPVRRQFAQAQLETRLATSGLPPSAQGLVRQQFTGRVFEAAELDIAIGAFKGMLGEVFGQSSIRGVGHQILDAGSVQGTTPMEKMQVAFDRLFGLDIDASMTGVPRLTGIREGYILLTGDKFFSGKYNWDESVVREANEVTTSILANVVLNSMTKRLVKDYRAQTRWWEPFAIKVPVTDMKQQNRIRLNDFASLATVAENGTYANLAWGDARENYTPSKFGNLVVITLEAFLNDDLHAITRIPTKVAHAAVTTINEQVANLFTQSSGTGPLLADGFRVFDAANHQGNTSTLVAYDLSSTALQTAMTVMEKIQNSASKRIGVRGKYLLIPPDLRWVASIITQSQYLAGSANNDINPLAGALQPIVVPQFTTAYQWYMLADPSQVESIEIGFLNGREEPELLVQDNPTVGQVFSNDAISYKVRHIYGLGWLDYRGAFGALPAS